MRVFKRCGEATTIKRKYRNKSREETREGQVRAAATLADDLWQKGKVNVAGETLSNETLKIHRIFTYKLINQLSKYI